MAVTRTRYGAVQNWLRLAKFTVVFGIAHSATYFAYRATYVGPCSALFKGNHREGTGKSGGNSAHRAASAAGESNAAEAKAAPGKQGARAQGQVAGLNGADDLVVWTVLCGGGRIALEALARAFELGDGSDDVFVPFAERLGRAGDEELALLRLIDDVGRDGLAIVAVGEADFVTRRDGRAQLFSSIVGHAFSDQEGAEGNAADAARAASVKRRPIESPALQAT